MNPQEAHILRVHYRLAFHFVGMMPLLPRH